MQKMDITKYKNHLPRKHYHLEGNLLFFSFKKQVHEKKVGNMSTMEAWKSVLPFCGRESYHFVEKLLCS